MKHKVKYCAYIYHNGGLFLGGWLLEGILSDRSDTKAAMML